ncbi:MAG: hypothetical protein Q9195_006051 [Heterodermia aff. obscurata]
MSATKTANGQSTHVNGFNEHTYYDPFIPSSPSEEQLVPTSVTPNLQSNYSPSPTLSKASNPTSARTSTSPPHTTDLLHQASHSPYLTNGFQQPDTSSQTLQDSFNYTVTDDFLTPNAYLSDNGYNGSSEHAGSPEYSGDYYLGNEINGVADPNFPIGLDDPQPYLGSNGADYAHIGRKISDDSNDIRRTSLGTATLASHLMSPVLTDGASPESRDGQGSPTAEGEALKIEAAHNTRLNSGDYSEGMSNPAAQMQHTPTLTSSSKNTSPDRNVRPEIARAASPVFRIESYSRGDSPARHESLMVRSGSKRSRGSSHLAVEQGDSSEDGEGEVVQDDYFQQHASPMSDDTRGRSFEASERPGLDPMARLQISTEEVPNFRDQEESASAAQRNADVEDWLAKSEGNSEAGGDEDVPARPIKAPTFSKRRRAKSAGDTLSQANLESLRNAGAPPADLHIPGPGLLLNEDSGEEDVEMSDIDEEGSDLPDTPPAVFEDISHATEVQADVPESPLRSIDAPPWYRAKLWQDHIYDSTDPGVKMQPASSNEAIYKFEQRSRELDSISRAATWGTRRLSESDLVGLFHRITMNNKDSPEDKEKPERRGTFLELAAAKLRPKRSGSVLKRKESESSRPASRPTALEHSKKDSSSSLGLSSTIKRMPSLGKKPKSPRIDTGSAVAGIATSIAALGAGTGGSVSATAASSPPTPWAAVKNTIKGNRSRNDIHPPSPPSKIGGLWNQQGGPPMPALAAPSKEDLKPQPVDRSEEVEEEDDEAIEEKGVTVDLTIRADPIIPTMDGFRSNVRQLNPRLPSYMVERVSQEQLRRYKKLMEFKIKHAQAINSGKCSSGKHCESLGGEPTYFPSKPSNKEPEMSHTGFSIAGLVPSDDDKSAVGDGVVTPAQFPAGVPMPPVKRLPAEFECSLCFKVKKFHKPSDWSKHVHEDVQPFTCTFANCAEPKSFKRKADWVRHENERHRQLEWWMCNMHECSHKCFRKDNFVQHLVREHKLPEPKIKTMKPNKPAVRGPSAQKARKQMEEHSEEFPEEIDQVWRLVEECRHETPKSPKDEACKFCGNICNSWKKLTVHLAKHMEQISMPVLNIVEQQHVTPETIISPIERGSQQPSMSPSIASPFRPNPAQDPSFNFAPPNFPGNFTQMHSPGGYYPSINHTPAVGGFQRHGPATYPPQLPTSPSPNFPASRPDHHVVPGFNDFDSPAPSSFITTNDPRGFCHSSSPENLYRPQAQPRSTAYGAEGPYQPPYQPQHQQPPYQQPQQQQQYPNGVKLEPNSNFAFTGPSAPMPHYQTQAPTSAPMDYAASAAAAADMFGMGYTQAPMGQKLFDQSNRNYGGYH